jgi:glycosyltransferase involved in cell wall biosynthesis
MAGSVEVSFCATNLNTSAQLPASLDSIEELGHRIGRPFETVVADGPSTDGAREILEKRMESHAGLTLVRHAERNRGYGRRRAFEASRGTTIVPFDTSLTYDPIYAGLLRGYLGLATDRMLFSELCALSRRSIDAVGGWRDLIGGEDIDLYSRVIRRFGVIAYPTAVETSQAAPMGAVARQLRYVRGSRGQRVRRIYAVQRDQMIGANFRVSDLMRFNAAKPASTRVGLWFFFEACALGAHFRGIPRIRADRNNYLVFREALLRSMQAGEYRELGWDGPPPQLLLTDDEIRYLSVSSALWHEPGEEVFQYVGRKG